MADTEGAGGACHAPRCRPADDVLDNLRCRLSALEQRLGQWMGDGSGDAVAGHDAAPNPVEAAAAFADGNPPLPQLQLEERLARIRMRLQANPPLCASVTDVATRLKFVTVQKKQWIQRNGALGSAAGPTDGHRVEAGGDAASSSWESLYRFSRDDYLRDLALLKTFALSRPCATQQASWRAVVRNLESVYGATSNGQERPGSGGGTSILTSSLLQGGVLQYNVSFQVDGETKTLDDLAALLHENHDALRALEARWDSMCTTFEHAVTWANRTFCEMDMALEVAETFVQ